MFQLKQIDISVLGMVMIRLIVVVVLIVLWIGQLNSVSVGILSVLLLIFIMIEMLLIRNLSIFFMGDFGSFFVRVVLFFCSNMLVEIVSVIILKISVNVLFEILLVRVVFVMIFSVIVYYQCLSRFMLILLWLQCVCVEDVFVVNMVVRDVLIVICIRMVLLMLRLVNM